MSNDDWVRGPFGLDAAMGSTVRVHRTVLVVAHHLTSATRLADIVPLVESDERVQVAYTASPASAFTGGLADYLRGLGGLVLPWNQATKQRFDLAIAASHGLLEDLRAPVMTVPHGSGPGKLFGRIQGLGPIASRPVTSLLPERLVVGGRVVPSAFVVAHERHLRLLEQVCPEAIPAAVVGGDPCLDRLIASLPRRDAYRRAFGIAPSQQLVFISSTWNEGSLLSEHFDLLFRAATELPRDKYRIVAALHPHIWSWHGHRQVNAWHAECRRLGVRLLPPEEGWRAALVAADRIIGDHGSVTYYGAALAVPVLLTTFPEDDVAPGSHIARLGAVAPRLVWDKPLIQQLDEAAHAFSADTHAALRADLSSKPGESARIIRREMYRLIRLPEPQHPPRVDPVPLPMPPPAPYGEIPCGGETWPT